MSPMQTASSRGRRRFAGCVLLLLFLLPHAPPSLSILLLFSVATPATCQRAREPESQRAAPAICSQIATALPCS